MKLRVIFSAIAGAALLLSTGFLVGVWARGNPSAAWPYPDSLDSVNAAPMNHKILFEDDKIRIVEVNIRPGQTEPLHGHKYSSIFIIPEAFAAGQDRDINGKLSPPIPRSLVDANFPLTVRMGPQAPHSYHNTDTVPNHFYRFEFKKMNFSGPGIGSLLQHCTKKAIDAKDPFCGE